MNLLNKKVVWKFFHSVVFHVLNIYYCLLYSICRLFPINRKLVIFESEEDFSDNSWAFYQYLLNNYPQYHFVWFCHSRNTVEKYSGKYARTKFVFHNYCFRSHYAAWYMACARYVFFTHGLGGQVKHRSGQYVLNLWHGIAIKGLRKFPPLQEKPFYNHLLYLGKMNLHTQALFLGCSDKLLLPLGYPRNDLLLNNIAHGFENPFVPFEFDGKVILWMPTFRASVNKSLSEEKVDTATGLPLLTTVQSIDRLNVFLQALHICIIVKIHHLQAKKDVFGLKYSNIVFVTDSDIADKGLQLYQIIGKSDALLSDYSSIAIDYLLTDKPMGFILDDLESYANSRGAFLFENITEILAGTHIYSEDELRAFLLEISQGIDSTIDIRNRLIPRMIEYPDAYSCKRIADFCKM